MESDVKISKMRQTLRDNLTSQVVAMSKACVHCGMCADSCHYYLSTGDQELIPSIKLEKFTNLFGKEFDPIRRRLPFKRKSDAFRAEKVDGLFKTAFEDCTLCGRCASACPMGINTRRIFILARAMFDSSGQLPEGLNEPIKLALETGNFIGMSIEDFVDNIEWLAEESGSEIGVEDFSIPIDKTGAETFYIPHPLEVRDNPFLFISYIKILHFAEEDYTFSTHHFDTTNYAFYQVNKGNILHTVKRILDAREKIQAKSIVLSPCGHGYRALRWESEKLLGKKISFPVYTFAELIDRYIQAGRIKVEKDTFEGPITYQDPCNMARLGGVIEEPRNILKALSSNFVEMQPSGALNFCCGGGGGLAATSDYAKTRVSSGKTKADQIRQTGAKIVATNCYNCKVQINELSKAYDLGVEVKSITELVADSLKH